MRSTRADSRRSTLRGLLFALIPIFVLILAVETWLLPSLPVLAAPHAAVRSLHSFSESAGHALAALAESAKGVPERPAGLSSPPHNISVIVPCFGHVPFLEETLASLVYQSYAPAEILVVDDGSEDQCGQAAARMLGQTLAAPRRRQVLTLQRWWGWGLEELEHFKDEVLRTPNRGVAHARNFGIRRAHGDWIVCLDGDDKLVESYFLKAMLHVALSPSTNLVYAKQQFFGESRWQWDVPPLRVDDAIVRGPLPLMTLFTKELWHGTPFGFDEALPKGHEDWAFWLQLTRLPLQPFKIDEFLTLYRFKKNSKMRNRERANPEVPRLLRCLFSDLYPVRKLLIDHHELLKPTGFSESVVMDVSVSQHLHPHRAETHLWTGMISQAKGELDAAVRAYNDSARLAAPYDWQGSFRLWRLLRVMPGYETAAAREEKALRARWGDEQFSWYATDVDGAVIPSVRSQRGLIPNGGL